MLEQGERLETYMSTVKDKNVNFETRRAALEDLFWNSAAQSDPTLRFWSVVQVPLAERCDRFRAVLQGWLDGLSPVIRTTVVQYAQLGANHPVDPGPVEWATETVRLLLETRFGKPSWPKTPAVDRLEDIWAWLAGDGTPYPPLVADIAYLSCAESLTSIRFSSGDPEGSIEINEAALAAWRAPRWLDFQLSPGEHTLHTSPTERWDQENTRLQLLAVQRWIWYRLDPIIETSRLEAVLTIPEKFIAETACERMSCDFEALSEDYRKILFRQKEFYLTRRQAEIVKVLHEELKKERGSGALSLTAINARLKGQRVTKMETIFRSLNNRGLYWKELIVSPRSGWYRLNVSKVGEES